MAGFGLAYLLINKKWLVLYPAGWALVGYVAFLNHSPIWYHHSLLINIPVIIVAAAGAGAFLSDIWMHFPQSLRRLKVINVFL